MSLALKFRIGTKLGISAAISTLLVLGMAANQLISTGAVEHAMGSAAGQQRVVATLSETLAAVLKIQLAVRDLRLAASADEAAKQIDDIRSRGGNMQKLLDAALGIVVRPENRERLQRVKKLVSDYVAGAGEIAAAQTGEEKQRIARERTLPIAGELEKLVREAAELAGKLADDASEEASSTVRQAANVGLIVAALVILMLIGSAVFTMFDVARPIRRIGAILLELANGNKQAEIAYAERGDEVGDAARAAQTFRDNLLRIEKLEVEQKEAEAKAAAQRKADMHKLADEFQAAVGGIVETVSSAATELEASAITLTKTADTTQQLSATVAAASEEASTNVQSVASASEEVAGSVSEIARQVQESSRIAGEAVKQAEVTDSRINQLSQSAQRIGDVVKLITAVAEQTNLLALNATIEAARAGEAGRGFAVVAQEVKALAAQTAKATDEIRAQISSMQTATQESVGAMKEIGGTISRISEIATVIAAAVEEQGAATQEIARNVNQAAEGTNQVTANLSNVSRGASETGTASSQVLSSAQSLANEGSHLKLEVDKFLAAVRAA